VRCLQKGTLRDATLLRVRGARYTVIPDLIRDPGQQAHLVRTALDSRLRGRDELAFAFAPSAFPTGVIPDLIRGPGRFAQGGGDVRLCG
jgi:hypothetical protein